VTESRPKSVEAWIAIAGLLGLWLALGSRTVEQARTHDFLALYTGAYMTSHGSVVELYDPAAQFAVEKKLAAGNRELVPFIRPPFYALMLAPMGWLPFRVAFDAWIGAQIAIFAACLWWTWRKFGTTALLLGSMSMPAALGIANGQDGPLFLAALIAAYALAEKGKAAASGAALGTLLVKFHLTPLWVVAMVAQRRWKMLAGFAAVGAAAAGASLAMVGVGGLRTYAALLQNRELAWLSPSPEFMIGFEGLASNLGIVSGIVRGAGIAVIVAVFAAAVWRAPLWRWYGLSTVASLLVAPHAYGYDAAMLLLGLWLAISYARMRTTKTVALWLCTPIPFAFTLAGRPWAAVSSLSMLAMLAALGKEGTDDDNRSPVPMVR
jgi:hypothetical protein